MWSSSTPSRISSAPTENLRQRHLCTTSQSSVSEKRRKKASRRMALNSSTSESADSVASSSESSGSSATAKSFQLSKRSERDLPSARSTMPSSAGGMAEFTCEGGGGSLERISSMSS